jgi:multimeric flavodoxin WrbA
LKKIIGLSCGRKNESSEMLLKAAAQGAEEFGVETEIIRAMALKVLPCNGCWGCMKTGKCIQKDDTDWILEKTCVDDCALIVSVPCYHIRSNSYLSIIGEKMNHVFDRKMDILKKTRVGALIGVGGSGYDAWTSLNLPTAALFLQHTRVLVDQMQVNFCALKEWNLWLQDKDTTAEHINEFRIQDYTHEEIHQRWPQPYNLLEFQAKAIERAIQLGRNVAQAMSLPIEKVQYKGEDYGVACPVCHSNVVVIPKDLPYIACPVCYVRGTVQMDKGKMTVKWNEADAAFPRFSYEAVEHHIRWLGANYGGGKPNERFQGRKKAFADYGKIIAPEKD